MDGGFSCLDFTWPVQYVDTSRLRVFIQVRSWGRVYLERLNSPLSLIPFVPLEGPSSGLSTSLGSKSLNPFEAQGVLLSVPVGELVDTREPSDSSPD